MNNIILRRETKNDYRRVEEITKEAFWNYFAPGCNEHYLIHCLRQSDVFIPELSIVAEVDNAVVGSIHYTKSRIVDDQEQAVDVISFGPLSVLPEFQGRGIGRKLVVETLKLAREQGYRAVLIYGDPALYSRFGFVQAETFDIYTPDNKYVAALQAFELYEDALKGVTGRFYEDEAFHISDDDSKIFDQSFRQIPEEEGLPSQKRFLEVIAMNRDR